jgi:hypothetical protein
MRMLVRDTAARANSADPGFTVTNLNGHRGTHPFREVAQKPSNSHCDGLLCLVFTRFVFSLGPSSVLMVRLLPKSTNLVAV